MKVKKFKKVVQYPDHTEELMHIIGATAIISSMIVGLILSVILGDIFLYSMLIGTVIALSSACYLHVVYREVYWVEVKESSNTHKIQGGKNEKI